MSRVEPTPLVSVIVPVYNAERWLRRCLDSIFAQTVQNFELITINDGSDDSSGQILADYMSLHPNMLVLEQVNMGQGAARNRALERARGKYVLFVDADDFIESVTLQVATERAEEDQSDLVRFDSKLYVHDPGRNIKYDYVATAGFWGEWILEGAQCDELLNVENQYSVTSLYRRSFLQEFGILFEEGRVYEENPFVVHSVNRARRVSLLHSPLYTIDPQPNSTTRTKPATDKFYLDHVHAVRRSFELLDYRNPRSKSYLASYHIKKFANYYGPRVPSRFRSAYVREFVDVLHSAGITDIAQGSAVNLPTRLYIKLKIFEKQHYLLFRWLVVVKNLVMPFLKQVKGCLLTYKRRLDQSSPWSMQLERTLKQPILLGTVSFIGLDARYTGNSRYLFEEMIGDPRFAHCDIRFVTEDPAVDAVYRLAPNDVQTNMHLARTQLLIAESWVPQQVRKHRDAIWVQLWHGTPIKRMLFDSHEPEIVSVRPQHKMKKYVDIQHWNYLVVDSEAAAEKFQTAFLFDPALLIHSGYPRVKYLLEHLEDNLVKQRTLEALGVQANASPLILLYAPTWRDYNYGRITAEADQDYLLDIETLAEQLGEGWIVLFHDHGYMTSGVRSAASNCIDASDVEIQELLLSADVVVSDYSSLVLDALAIGKRVVLYAKDMEKFEQSRGLYRDTWADLRALAMADLTGLGHEVSDGPTAEVISHLQIKYCYDSKTDLLDELLRKIETNISRAS